MNALKISTDHDRRASFGLFTTSLAVLMYENLLTRIFSVTMWYHFAFMAVSIALFGLTFGAVIVYLFPKGFSSDKIQKQLALSALLFSITIVAGFLIHINTPPAQGGLTSISLLITYMLVGVPFIFAGINITLMLTKYPGRVGKLYAADLSGAALGCIMFIIVLNLTDGPTAVIVTAAIASIAALFYAWDHGGRALKRAALSLNIALISLVAFQILLAGSPQAVVRLHWVKGFSEELPIVEKWNSFSRVRVTGDPFAEQPPFGWGISQAYPKELTTQFLRMDIDNNAATAISAFDGDLETVVYLKYDVTNLVHYLRSQADVLVIGAGGGRDILSALVFEQRSVTGVEINENITDILKDDFGDYSGHLDQIPGVTFVTGEARSYIARSDERYDIIQASLIDTWAATAAGAFVLSENSLYTLDAWKVFLEHLSPEGILSFSRWYFPDMPGEMYRLTALASEALLQFGVENPRAHILIVRHAVNIGGAGTPDGVGTLLVSPAPFTQRDVETIERVAAELSFEVVLTPERTIDSNFEKITSPLELEEFLAEYPLNIAPPTDDQPFFFQMLKFSDLLDYDSVDQGLTSINASAVNLLGALLLTVILLSLLFIVSPLLLTTKKRSHEQLSHTRPLSLFFAAIGLGFMMVEISQLQRLIVFLGHPTYSLSVVLFSLLISGGLGSYLTQRIERRFLSSLASRLLVLLGVLAIFGLTTPSIISGFAGAATPLRIGLAVVLLSTMGVFMGMAFPLGMKIVAEHAASMAPWFWGINGAISVCASVLAVVISILLGISTSFWMGFASYLMAWLLILWIKSAEARRGLL